MIIVPAFQRGNPMRSILTFAALSCFLVAPAMAADVDYDVPPEALYD